MMSASQSYASYMSSVCLSDSPFFTLVPSVPANPVTRMPSRIAAISKLVRVRVEFS